MRRWARIRLWGREANGASEMAFVNSNEVNLGFFKRSGGEWGGVVF